MRTFLLILLFLCQPVLAQYPDPTITSEPEDWFERSKVRILENEKKGLYRENLSIFESGHRKGYFYFLHPSLPRYEPYLQFGEFDLLVKADRNLHEAALGRSQTLYRVELPDSYSASESYPLVLIFHGGNSNLQRVSKHWNHESLDQRFIKVYLQSYRHFDSRSYTWRSGDPRSDKELSQIFTELNERYAVDSSRIVVAGISAGANYAMGMALRGILPVKGFMAFCPGLPAVFRNNAEAVTLNADIRGYVLGGEHDFYLEQQEALMGHFEDLSLPCAYVRVKGMGHQYPENEGDHIIDGLKFVLEE